MSKSPDAILKAKGEQAAQRKRSMSSEPAPKPQVEKLKRKVTQGQQPLGGVPKIGRQHTSPSPKVRDEAVIARASANRFVARLDTIFAEQFRKLKSIVLTNNRAKPLRSILLTSCMPAEGKTTVALNLSATIATGLDDSAILIDADLRKRTLTEQLGLEKALGLSDILEEKATIEEVISHSDIEKLTILPAGSYSANPARLIESTRMKRLIEQLAGRYKDSYIIIDSPPIIATSEANTLSQMVDGIILVVLADETRRDVAKRELVSIDRDKILGVVLNGAEFETSHYYNKYYKSYYGVKKKGR